MSAEPVAAEAEPINWDQLPSQARVVGIYESQVDLVADPFDGFMYGIRPGDPVFAAVRYQLEEAPGA